MDLYKILEVKGEIERKTQILLGSIDALIYAQNEAEVNNEKLTEWINSKYENIILCWNDLQDMMKVIEGQVQNEK